MSAIISLPTSGPILVGWFMVSQKVKHRTAAYYYQHAEEDYECNEAGLGTTNLGDRRKLFDGYMMTVGHQAELQWDEIRLTVWGSDEQILVCCMKKVAGL